MLLNLASSSSSPRAAAAATTMMTTTRNDLRALQLDDGSANNPKDMGTGNSGMPRETEDAPPPTPVPTPEATTPVDPCLICDKGAPLYEDIVIPTMDNGTTCVNLSLYASTLELDSSECSSIRLAKSMCCFQSMSPTAPPSDDPTVTVDC